MDAETRKRLKPVVTALVQGKEPEWITFRGQPAVRLPHKDGSQITILKPGDRDSVEEVWQKRLATVAEVKRLQARPPPTLTTSEVEALHHHGIVCFEGRFITEARPPVTDAEVTEIERQLVSGIPPELRALWSASFGGRLDYELQARFECVDFPLQFPLKELFYPGSDHYRDLAGWMEHELDLAREVAEEKAEPLPSRLSDLPFGGFENCARAYVALAQSEYGAVIGWRQGARWLPNDNPLSHDTATLLAENVCDLFRKLYVDPETVIDEWGCLDPYEGALPAFERVRAAGQADLADRAQAIYLATTATPS